MDDYDTCGLSVRSMKWQLAESCNSSLVSVMNSIHLVGAPDPVSSSELSGGSWSPSHCVPVMVWPLAECVDVKNDR